MVAGAAVAASAVSLHIDGRCDSEFGLELVDWCLTVFDADGYRERIQNQDKGEGILIPKIEIRGHVMARSIGVPHTIALCHRPQTNGRVSLNWHSLD